jgi:uncharacterized membrane protein
MQPNLTHSTKRIESIDIVRGLVMVIMALDHVRDYIHIYGATDDPLNFATTTPILFLTRWITHFCAPTFVFLSGSSVYLQSLRKTKKELSAFLIKRGLWLIFAEFFIISLGWTFNPFYNAIPFQVIWAIGISMLILGIVIKLPFKIVLAIGLGIVLLHNLLDIPETAKDFKAGFFWDLLHHGNFTVYQFAQNHFVIIAYPFLPWTGWMMLGYCFGIFFGPGFTRQERSKIFARMGFAVLLFFIILRSSNFYGDPDPWSVQKNTLFTFFSFIKVHKYPPSLLYLCMTIVPILFLLAYVENIKNWTTNKLVVFGRTAFFYYILHLYLIHLICTVFFFARGHSVNDAIKSMPNLPFMFQIPGEGYGLDIVYLVWALVIVALYPICNWYDKYKTNHKEKWWLSYI